MLRRSADLRFKEAGITNSARKQIKAVTILFVGAGKKRKKRTTTTTKEEEEGYEKYTAAN